MYFIPKSCSNNTFIGLWNHYFCWLRRVSWGEIDLILPHVMFLKVFISRVCILYFAAVPSLTVFFLRCSQWCYIYSYSGRFYGPALGGALQYNGVSSPKAFLSIARSSKRSRKSFFWHKESTLYRSSRKVAMTSTLSKRFWALARAAFSSLRLLLMSVFEPEEALDLVKYL